MKTIWLVRKTDDDFAAGPGNAAAIDFAHYFFRCFFQAGFVIAFGARCERDDCQGVALRDDRAFGSASHGNILIVGGWAMGVTRRIGCSERNAAPEGFFIGGRSIA